ncbi:hypothetical protein JCM8202v2_005915 [Rhodotorula sphaerocarpa]
MASPPTSAPPAGANRSAADTAGSTPDARTQKATVFDAVRTIDPLSDLQRLPNMPCARYSLLFGIVAGVSVGALRFIFSRAGRRGTLRGGSGSPWSEAAIAANWAVAEAARMQALVSEIKARRSSRSDSNDASSSSTIPPRRGGLLVGDKGKEVFREQQGTEQPIEAAKTGTPTASSSQVEDGRGGKSWFSGRI